MSAGRAVLVSIALHTTLLVVLLGIERDDGSPAPSAPRFVRVAIVQADGPADLAEAATTAAPGDAIEAAAEAASTPDTTDPVAATPAPIADAVVPIAEAPAPDTPDAPAPEPQVPAPASAPAAADAADAADVVTPAPRPLAVRDARAAEPVAIPQTERRMLDREVAEWAARAAADDGTAPTTTWTHDGHAYTATFTRVPAADSMGIDAAIVAVSTERGGSRWSTEIRMQRLAFSSFAQFVDRWDPNVQIHDDEIEGRFHSNSEIYVASTGGVRPAFHGKVTTASGVNTSLSKRRVVPSQVFLGGLETRVQRIVLPKRFVPFADRPPAHDDRVQRFEADARIVFYADGTYGWRYVDSSDDEQRVALTDTPAYLLAADKVVLHLEGVVNGKVLVYSPRGIVIEGDLVYAAPALAPDADDYLGLVSDNTVEIAEPSITGPGDLTIHASIYAKRRFVVRSYRTRASGTLSVYGSVAAGAVSATEPRFRTKLAFDPRLERLRAPGFPMTERYEPAAWSGEWTVEPADEDARSLAAHETR